MTEEEEELEALMRLEKEGGSSPAGQAWHIPEPARRPEAPRPSLKFAPATPALRLQTSNVTAAGVMPHDVDRATAQVDREHELAPVTRDYARHVNAHETGSQIPQVNEAASGLYENTASTTGGSQPSSDRLGGRAMTDILRSGPMPEKDKPAVPAQVASRLNESTPPVTMEESLTVAETKMSPNAHEDGKDATVDNMREKSGAKTGPPTSHSETTSSLEEALNTPTSEYPTWAKVWLRGQDMPFHIFGGILAGNNELAQSQYQKHPFKPFNWVLGYDDPPTEQEARQWTTAQISFNDALEAGLAAKNSPSLRANEKVTIKVPAVKGDGSPGMIWVLEPTPRLDTPAGRYQAEIPSVADARNTKIWVPALGFVNRNNKGYHFVKFDGIDIYKRSVVDRKFNITGFAKQKEDIERQVEALIQNPEWTLVLEVPSAEVGRVVSRLYTEAIIKATPSNGPIRPIPNITLDIVRPGTTDPQKFDAGPTSEVEPPRSEMHPIR